MKAITIRPTEMMNPEFSEDAKRKALADGMPYRVKRTVMTDPGRHIEHRECWRLVNMGLAVPADEECRQAADMTEEDLVKTIANQELIEQGRATGKPEYDGPRKPSKVQLPAEWSHLTDQVAAEIEKRQNRIDELHSTARREAEEEKAEGKVMYVVDATELPPDTEELPPEE